MFSHVYCINRDDRPERMAAFWDALPGEWPFGPVHRFAACTATTGPMPKPLCWKHHPNAWGCLCSHYSLLCKMLDDEWEDLLILEDDCIFADRFAEKATAFLDEVPRSWDMIYFGGQHFRGRPRLIVDGVLLCHNVNRTHAYAIRPHAARLVVDACRNPSVNKHIDYVYGDLQSAGAITAYAPLSWLAGQAEGPSDIAVPSPDGSPAHKRAAWWNSFPYDDEQGHLLRCNQ